MIDPITSILSGLLIAVISGVIGKSIGSNRKVNEGICIERQKACQSLLIEKIDNLDEKVDNFIKIVNTKLLGL
jgi:hypothetical protein